MPPRNFGIFGPYQPLTHPAPPWATATVLTADSCRAMPFSALDNVSGKRLMGAVLQHVVVSFGD